MPSSDPRFTLHVELPGDDASVVRMTIDGELDMAGAAPLLSAFDGVPDGASLELDLRGVSFLDSSGLRTLLASHRQRPTSIVAASDAVARLCKIAGVEFLLSPH